MVATNDCQAFETIPVIDVSSFLTNKGDDAKRVTACELHRACKDVGFFYIINHGIPEELLSGVLEKARSWFALPETVKNEIKLSAETHYRGYQPLGSNVTRYDGGFARDWHEGIDLYREGQVGCCSVTPVHGNNPWPVQLPEFKAQLQQYFESCLLLGQLLMRGIALGLGLDETYFETSESGSTTAETSYWVSRILHYPPLSEGDAHVPDQLQKASKGDHTERSLQLSCGEHSDYGLLTLVNQQPGMEALQVKNQDGRWISASPIPGTLVCNIGDMLQVYTNGLYTPTAHRVINADPSKSRVSLPFFYECAFDTVVRPIKELVKEDYQVKFKEVQYGEHLLAKVLNNFEL